jgi:hypothetical protein
MGRLIKNKKEKEKKRVRKRDEPLRSDTTAAVSLWKSWCNAATYEDG